MNISTDNVPTIVDGYGFPLGMPRPVRIVESVCSCSDAAVYALLSWCYDLPGSSLRNELIEALSIRLMLSATRADPADPSSTRYIELDEDLDGGSVFRVFLGTGAEVDGWEVVYASDLSGWASNLYDVQRIAGPDRLLDLHQFRYAALAHRFSTVDGYKVGDDDDTGMALACARITRALFVGDVNRLPSERDWNAAAMLDCCAEDVTAALGGSSSEITVGHLRKTLRDRLISSVRRKRVVERRCEWEDSLWLRQSSSISGR